MKKTKYPRLPKKFKEKWLKALRSGEYEQGEGVLLNDKNQFCCLGVGCDIMGVSQSSIIERGLPYKTLHGNIPEYFDHLNNGNWQDILTEMNDEGKPFTYISEWIEKNL